MATILKSKSSSSGSTPLDASAARDVPSRPLSAIPQRATAGILKSSANPSHAKTNDVKDAVPIASRGIASKISGAIVGKFRSGSDGLAEFNLADLAEQGRDELTRCRAEVESILNQARAESESLKQQAHQDGLAEGRKAAEDEIRTRIDREAETKATARVQSLHQAVLQIRNQYDQWMTQYADVMIATAIAAAERLTRQKIALKPSDDAEHLLVRWASEALHSTRSAGRLTLAVHPDTLAELGKQFDELLADPDLPEQSTVIPDESVNIGDVVVRQDGGEIRAGLDAQLSRLREELLGDQDGFDVQTETMFSGDDR